MSVLVDGYRLALLQYNTLNNYSGSIPVSSTTGAASSMNENSDVKFELPVVDVSSEITYTNGPNITYSGKVNALSDPKVINRLKEYNIPDIVSMASEKYDIPANLIYKVIETESYFNPECKSSAGAMGLMQLMPFNCDTYGVTNPYDPYQNIMAGTKHLREYIDMFNGDLKLGLAAYNAGPGNVRKYGGVPPFKETQNYIKKILGA